jgi:peptidoglycan hydrolase-like protein with peptidoglycan-binding domain
MEKSFKELKLTLPQFMEGDDVRKVQQSLKKLGYKIKVNGMFDEVSQNAVKKFQ